MAGWAEELGFAPSVRKRPFGARSGALLEGNRMVRRSASGLPGLPVGLSARAFCPESHHPQQVENRKGLV